MATRTIAAHRSTFRNQVFANGTKRGTPERIFQEHAAQVNLTQHPPGEVVKPHYHTVDEILYLLDGGLTLADGPSMPRGSVILFGANTKYGFTVGTTGVTWLALRPTRPHISDLEQSDSLYDTPPAGSQHRSVAVPGDEVESKPWVQLRPGVSERRAVEGAGSPTITFVRMTGAAAAVEDNSRGHRFLYVLAGSLQVDAHEHGSETVVSVPAGVAAQLGAGNSGTTYLRIEMPPAAASHEARPGMVAGRYCTKGKTRRRRG